MVVTMYLPRFYVPDTLELDHACYILPKAVAHHALRVLRLEQNHQILLFNGQGGEFLAKITETHPHVVVQLLAYHTCDTESSLHTILIQGLCQTDKMDWIIQKAVELGVTEIYPIACERSVTKLDEKKAQKRYEHWQQIIIAATEQSRRTRLAQLHPVMRFDQLVAHFSDHSVPIRHLFCDPTATNHLKTWINPLTPLPPFAFWIGPEGGFSPKEHTTFYTALQPTGIRLGPRILRTETAGLSVLAVLQTLYGDWQ